MRANDVSRFGYIFCHLCRCIINALESKPHEADDPLGSDATFSTWICDACDMEAKRALEHKRANGADPNVPTP